MGGKKRYEAPVEMGTAGNKNQVDLDWIPREHINIASPTLLLLPIPLLP